MTNSSKARILQYLLLITLVAFAFASIVVGSILRVYAVFWWWDDMLHTISGILLGLVGLVGIYLFNAKHTMKINPFFVALFVFCFSMTLGVLWEFFEFCMDDFFGTAMQQYDLPASAIVIGRSYQGMGLRDTMSDLMHGFLGALAVGIFAYFAWKRGRGMILAVGRRVFWWVGKKHADHLSR